LTIKENGKEKHSELHYSTVNLQIEKSKEMIQFHTKKLAGVQILQGHNETFMA